MTSHGMAADLSGLRESRAAAPGRTWPAEIGDGSAEIGVCEFAPRVIDLITQSWALRLNASQTDAAGEESHDAAHLTLDIAGPWSAPTVRAIGHGGATEPAGDPPPSR
jgi:hypothetical protein